MAISIELLKQLRAATGAGIQECRKALEQAHEDAGKALESLRQQNAEKIARLAERPAFQGVIELYSHGNGRVGVMVEVNTETEFAARTAAFRAFAHEIALQIAAAAPHYIRDEDIPNETLEQEAQKAAGRARQEGKPEKLVPRIMDGYVKKFKDKTVLLRQPYIRDESLTIQQMLDQAIASIGEKIAIRRMARWELSSNDDQGE
jgi:elongation factor Ts